MGHYRRKKQAPALHIIKDIEPYQAVATDVRTGKPPKIGSRSRHREFLKDNGYHEVGTEQPKPRKIDYNDVTPREVRQVYERLRDSR